jgi:hypothetical protein
MALASTTRAYKHSINQVFRTPDAAKLDVAVRYVHSVMGDASLLVKYRLLKLARSGTLDRNLPLMVVDETEVMNAIRAVEGRRLPPPVPEDAPANKSSKRTAAFGTTKELKKPSKARVRTDGASTSVDSGNRDARQHGLDAWAADYAEMASACGRPPEPLAIKGDGISVSHVLGIAAKQYAAAVLANVRYHFREYVCAALGVVLRSKVCTSCGVRSFDAISATEAKRWRRAFSHCYDDVLFHRAGDAMRAPAELRDVVERHRWHLVPRLPDRTPSIDRDLDSAQRPFVYLGYMIRSTAFLEATGARRLKSPLPLKTSFIPAHYHFDTTSIAHLLMDAQRIKGFKAFFELSVRDGFPLPGLTDKAALSASLKKLSGRDTDASPAEEELFKDALWTYLADFKNRRTKVLNPLLHTRATRPEAMRFDHSISTDGYSVTLVVSDRAVRGRKHLYKSAVSARTKKKKVTPQEFPVLDPQTARDVATSIADDAVLVAGDPGKHVILQMIDEADRVLRYTSGQRRNDTWATKRSQAIRQARSRPWKGTVVLPPDCGVRGSSQRLNPTVVHLEREMGRHNASRLTCDPGTLRRYVAFREASRAAMEATYERRLFRASRFTAWSLRRASVEGLTKRILETYGGSPRRQVVILYGNWGRQPNLKNQAPTPGIGLRRLIHATPGITTITVNEAYTSSVCPECDGEVEHGRGKHGVLRCCGAEGCGTWWSRDVLGAKNILRKATHLLREGIPHPAFER